jgi:predicted O-methyltransferase YrrM
MITDPAIEKYLAGLIPPRDEVLSEMEALAARQKIQIVGPAVATFLSLLVTISGAKRIFELGSAIGYSTIWLARAAGAGGEVHYSDGSAENAKLAQEFFERAGVAAQIRIHVGDALTALAGTPGQFDMLFNDVDKDGYPAVLDAAPSRLKSGGLFVTDNTLWHGRVLHPESAEDRAVADFNRRLTESQAFRISSLLPIRDGVSVAVRV